MNHHILTGKVDVTSNLLVGSSHLFVDTTNNRVGLDTNYPHAGLHVNSNAYVDTDLRVGSQIEINTTPGRVKATSFEGDGSLLVNAPVGSLAVHSTDTGLPGTDAIVTNEGTPTAAEFKFVIPRGDVGATGSAATIAVGTTTTGAAGSDASVTNSGTTSAAVFDFTVPRGDQGIQGIQGIQGETGTAATVTVGTTTTGVPGTNASVTNTGSSSAASFDFTIPRGDTGATGPAGTVAIGTTTTGAAGSSASVTNTGTSTAANLEFTVPKGDQGIQGVQGPAATIAVGTTTTSAPGTNGSVTNSGSSSAAVFDFTVPRGADGTNYFTLSGSDIYRSTGSVGIGVTDPDSKLEVRGNIRASFSDTNHGMFIDAGGTILHNYGGNGAGLHFTSNAIWPTNYLGSYSVGGIDLGSSSYRWNNVYTEALNASGTIDSTGIITCNANKMVITGSSPTLYLRDSDHRTGMIHQNDNRMYFLSGVANSDSSTQTANSRWPLYLQMDTNEAVFGGNIDAAVGTVTASTFSATSRINIGTSASIRQSSTSSWTGDPGSGVGKLEYHSNRWYIVAGSNSTELLQVRRNNTNKFTIDNNGSISLGIVPAARISGTVASATTANGTNGASKIVVQNGTDGGSSKGIYMWTPTDTNWGIYMAQSGAGKALSGGTAPAGNGFTAHAIRFRTYSADANRGWIFEGSNDETKVSIRSSDGHLYAKGYIQGAYNTDTTSYFGRTAIGYCGHGDWSSIAHIDRNNTNDYALLHNSAGLTLLNCSSNQSIRFRSGNTDRMAMDSSGHLGINIISGMTAMLDIRGAFGSMSSGTRRYFHYNTNITGNYGGWGTKSIYATGDIVTNGWVASHSGVSQASDRRIKTDIVDADDLECLDTLRQLQPKKYKYKDVLNKGETPVWGFIAQEVRDTLPYATNTTTDFIPNIYELGTVSSSNVITLTNFNTSNLHSNTSSIRIMDKEDTPRELTLVEIIDEHTIRVQEDPTEFATEDGEVFVYGEEVDDFVFLKKDAIFTVAVSALQEVDRQLQAEKVKTRNLEALVLSLITRVQKLEAR